MPKPVEVSVTGMVCHRLTAIVALLLYDAASLCAHSCIAGLNDEMNLPAMELSIIVIVFAKPCRDNTLERKLSDAFMRTISTTQQAVQSPTTKTTAAAAAAAVNNWSLI